MMDVKEFSIEWMKKKYPDDHTTIIADDVLEFAKDWAGEHNRQNAIDFAVYAVANYPMFDLYERRDDIYKEWIKEGKEPKTPPTK